MHSLYLLIDLFTVLVPLVFSFHPRIQFYRLWKPFVRANLLGAAVFIAWDIGFTRAGVWSFNPRYVTGLYFFNLPLEEVLFFICIPYSCIFTYYCLDTFYDLQWRAKFENIFFILFPVALLMVGIIFWDRLYTSVTFISTAIFVSALKFIFRVPWLGKLFSVYAILLIPFAIVNGILTGTGIQEAVVQYNDAGITGLRLLTIPVEDIFYGLLLLLLNMSFFKKFEAETGK